ncbi:restriction endonuclease [Streptomyces sp. NPDC014986]|uniref:restriction endonuclease n=1 Tax=Streptomyces sp. NPDC014986 TaxID=3364934 RepID=UPI0036F72DE3
MTVPARAPRPVRRSRRFELRSTALYFVLLAVILTSAGTVVRTVTAAAERRPAWAVALVLVGVGALVAAFRRRRRIPAARLARHAAKALDEATETAVEALDTARPPSAAPPAPAAGPVDARTVPLSGPVNEASADVAGIGYEALDPAEFEQAVAELCRRDGCLDVEVVGGAGDLGADVVARTPDGRLVVIQCKRYCEGNRVGSQDMQRFGGTCFTVHGADVAVMVTTSDFTAPAIEYAEQCGIVCVEGRELLRWQDGVGPRPWEAASAAG